MAGRTLSKDLGAAHLGDLLSEQGSPFEALAAYERSLDLYPRRFKARRATRAQVTRYLEASDALCHQVGRVSQPGNGPTSRGVVPLGLLEAAVRAQGQGKESPLSVPIKLRRRATAILLDNTP